MPVIIRYCGCNRRLLSSRQIAEGLPCQECQRRKKITIGEHAPRIKRAKNITPYTPIIKED